MTGLVEWFVKNHIAANLLMVLIILGGIFTMPRIDKEFFPQPELNTVLINIVYPGASPSEIEKQLCLRIEEALDGIDGVKELRCTADEGFASAEVEAKYGYSSNVLLNEVKSRIDAVTTFPVDI